MLPTSPVKTLLTLVVFSLLSIGTGWAKPPDPLAATRARLDELELCLGKTETMATLRKGLLWGWKKPGDPPTLLNPPHPPPPPPEYLDSIDRDLAACRLAATIQDEGQRRIILSSVEKDIKIKADDCHTFGMGRKVPVTIKTVRGARAENGWQVFYKWSCASLLQPQEVRVPNLTSPANVELPPGVYSIRAEKRNASNQVETIAAVTVVVGLAASVPLELPIP